MTAPLKSILPIRGSQRRRSGSHEWRIRVVVRYGRRAVAGGAKLFVSTTTTLHVIIIPQDVAGLLSMGPENAFAVLIDDDNNSNANGINTIAEPLIRGYLFSRTVFIPFLIGLCFFFNVSNTM